MSRVGDVTGYETVRGNGPITMIFVYDPVLFRRFVTEGQGTPELVRWAAGDYSPPVICCNGYIWVLSPGVQPDWHRYVE